MNNISSRFYHNKQTFVKRLFKICISNLPVVEIYAYKISIGLQNVQFPFSAYFIFQCHHYFILGFRVT